MLHQTWHSHQNSPISNGVGVAITFCHHQWIPIPQYLFFFLGGGVHAPVVLLVGAAVRAFFLISRYRGATKIGIIVNNLK